MNVSSRYALLSIIFLSACTPLQLPLHRDDLKLLGQNPTVYVVTFRSTPFEVDTSANVALIGGVLGGAVGAAVGAAAGALVAGSAANATDRANATSAIDSDPRALVRSMDYDPVTVVRDEFVAKLRDNFKMSSFVIIDGPLEDESAKSLSERFHDGIVLGFKTEQRVLEIVPLSSDYWIRYRGRGMFFSPREGRYLWRELCGFIPKDSSAPLHDLAANSGEELKNRLAGLGRRCAQQLFAEILESSS